jgi:4-aminobutyrate aminotransferase-like enzyme
MQQANVTTGNPAAKPGVQPAAAVPAIQPAIQHPGEERSNDLRRRLAVVEPAALRTYTPSLTVIARSEGSYHWTPEGRRLADFTSGVLVANLGHNPAGWWRRVWKYMGIDAKSIDAASGFFSAQPLTAYNAATELEVQASERLVATMKRQAGGARMEQVAWAASGSEAIQKSLWAALSYQATRKPGCDQILATRYGFHGKKGLASAVTGSEQDPDRDERVHFISFPREECIDLARRRGPIDLEPYAAELNDLWQKLDGKIAALVTEPYLGGGGSYHPQPAYLQLLERFCREHDIIFILDEVQANFGRTGELLAYSHYGIEPDIVVLGKGLGNGIAVDAAVGRTDVFGSLKYGEVSDTWSGGPLGCAAVLATLDEFESGEVLEQAQKLAEVIEKGLCRLSELDLVAHVRGEGVVWGIELGPVGKHMANAVAAQCVKACYLGDDRGRAIHLLGPLAGKVLRVSPPLVMPLAEAKDYLDAMYEIFKSVGEKLQK